MRETAGAVAGGETRATHREIKHKLAELYEELFRHDGYGELHLEIRILRRGQKEVIIRSGKQYRYIVDYRNAERRKDSVPYEGAERRENGNVGT